MLIDNYRHIHIYENCSANKLSVNFSIVVTSLIFSPFTKGLRPVSVPAKNTIMLRDLLQGILLDNEDSIYFITDKASTAFP